MLYKTLSPLPACVTSCKLHLLPTVQHPCCSPYSVESSQNKPYLICRRSRLPGQRLERSAKNTKTGQFYPKVSFQGLCYGHSHGYMQLLPNPLIFPNLCLSAYAYSCSLAATVFVLPDCLTACVCYVCPERIYWQSLVVGLTVAGWKVLT